MSPKSREEAAEARAIQLLLDKLEADVVEGTLAGACLDALLALLAGSPANQGAFLELHGLQKVALATVSWACRLPALSEIQ